jgi:OmpA-OmpF porin, OOP family
VADAPSWNESRAASNSRLPGPDRLGWWAAVAMLVSILLHVVAFFTLDRLKIAFQFSEAEELSTRAVDLRQVEVRPDDFQPVAPDEVITQPSRDSASLMEEIDVLAKLPQDLEIDMKPVVKEAVFALSNQNPAKAGTPAAMALEISTGFDAAADLPELGRVPETIKPAAVGQLTVDPGSVQADDQGFGKFTDNLIQQGANGKVENGTLDGMASLDSMLSLPQNILLGAKTMLPSDLLFEFNSTQLRESAKVGLLKLGLLMDRNPELYCWIEGHTDLVGGDEFNLKLSIQRAEAVKAYLVKSMRMDASKISTRGFGRSTPLIVTGTAEEQAGNRRVEIRMRKTQAPAQQAPTRPQRALVVPDPPESEGILVKPKRAIPVEELEAPARAMPVEGPVEPEIPRAIPRAEAVE